MTNLHDAHVRAQVLVSSVLRDEALQRAFAEAGYEAVHVSAEEALDTVDIATDAVIISLPREQALDLCRRLKTRHQLPVLPVAVLLPRPDRLPEETTAPDTWLDPDSPPREIVARVQELARFRRSERERAGLSQALAELAAENGRLYERARRDAEATALLLRELQHRVRNNLAAIQALLVLERHRQPPRPLAEALDVAMVRLRSMAALQDSLAAERNEVEAAKLGQAVARGALEIFGQLERVRFEASGSALLSSRAGSSVAILLNELITNALKHADATVIRLEVESNDGRVDLLLSDDGCGMAEDVREGTGLLIARAVVRNELGGALQIERAERGSRIRVSFPTVSAAAQ